jgi:hypothetical protein
MKRMRVLILAALVLGCGSDGSDFDLTQVQAALAGCTESNVTTLLQTLVMLAGVPGAINAEVTPPGAVYDYDPSADALDPPFTYVYSIVFDTNTNGIHDSALTGKVTFSQDPTLEPPPGATIVFDFDLQNSPVLAGAAVEQGTVTGSGAFTATIGATPEEVALTGTATLNAVGGGCTAVLSFPVTAPLNIIFAEAPALAANTGYFEVFGTINVAVESVGHTLTAVLTAVKDVQTISATGDIDGIPVSFNFAVTPSPEVAQQLAECATFAEKFLGILAATFQELADSGIASGDEPPGVDVTVVSPTMVDYSVDLAVFDADSFLGGTLSGTATATFPALSGLQPDEISFSWALADVTLVDKTLTLFGQSGTGRPLRVALSGGVAVSASGAGSFAVTDPGPLAGAVDCDISFDIPEDSPIVLDGSASTILFTVSIGEDIARVALIDAILEGFTINGIPYPVPKP